MQVNKGIKTLQSRVNIQIQAPPLALYLYVPPKLTVFLQMYLSYENDMKNITYIQMILA